MRILTGKAGALLALACALCAARGRAVCATVMLEALRHGKKTPPEVRPFVAEGRTRDLMIGLRTMVPDQDYDWDWYAVRQLRKFFDVVELDFVVHWNVNIWGVRYNLQQLIHLRGKEFEEMMGAAGRRALFPCPWPCAADFGRFRLRALGDPRIAELAGRAPLDHVVEMRRSLEAELADAGVRASRADLKILSYGQTAVGLLVALAARHGEGGASEAAEGLLDLARARGVRSLFRAGAGKAGAPRAPWEPVLFGER